MSFQKIHTYIVKSKTIACLLFLFFFSILGYWRFSNIIEDFGSEKLLEIWGDGLKTPTNMMYHIDYGTSNNWFEGMNYPYGDHIVASTELAGIAMFLKAIKPIFPSISEWVPTLIHGEMILAFLFCGFFFFLLLQELKLPFWYSFLTAIGLTFLNPLFPRMGNHFGLAQPFLFPCLLYGLLLFERKPSFKISFSIGLLVFIASMLHFYFFGILVLMISLYFLFRFIITYLEVRNIQTSISYALGLIPHYFLMVGVSFLFFYFWMLSQDPVIDRSPEPWGFLVYLSRWEGVFLWKENPFIEQWTGFVRETQMEGRSYVGMVATAYSLFVILSYFYRVLKKKLLKKSSQNQDVSSTLDEGKLEINPQFQFFKASLFMAISLLIFSWGIPFIFQPFEWLLDYIGPLRQFRSIGRFAWPFYFVINIYAFYYLYFFIKKLSIKGQLWSFGTLFFLLFFEAITFSTQTDLTLKTVKNWTSGISVKELGIDFSKYQAVVPLPYFSIGSKDFNQTPEGILLQKTGVLSAKIGLPTTGAMLTRSSFSQTYNQWQMLLQPYRKPIIFDDFKNEKPLLFITYKKSKKAKFMRYRHLLEGAKLIQTDNDLEYYHVELSDFEDRITKKRDEIKEAIVSQSLTQINGFLSTDSIKKFIYHDFEELDSEDAYLSNGANTLKLNEKNVLFEGAVPLQDTMQWYHFLTWVNIYEDGLPSTLLQFEELDSSGMQLQNFYFFIWPCVQAVDTNGWALMEFAFRCQNLDSHIRLSSIADEKDYRQQFYDSFLLKPTKTHLYKKGKTYLWKDNLYFPSTGF